MDALNKAETQSLLIPCIGWLRRYQKDWLRRTSWPVNGGCSGHSQGNGLCHDCRTSVQWTLHAFLPMLIYAALGTSLPLSVSTTTTIAILTGVLLGQVARGDMASLISALATLGLLLGHAGAGIVSPLGSSPTSSPNPC